LSQNLFKWKHFEKEITLLYVRWYLKYPLSYRMLVEMVEERGLNIAHTTIMRWVHQYLPIINERMRKHLKSTNDPWRVNETYIKIKGKDSDLYRSVDSEGIIIDFVVSDNRDKKTAKEFFKKALGTSHNQQPRVITTDKYGATEVAITVLIYSKNISCKATHRMVKYLNNIIEQDHRFIKRKVRPMLGFGSFESAEKTIAASK
jgi:transposase, IS6 family